MSRPWTPPGLPGRGHLPMEVIPVRFNQRWLIPVLLALFVAPGVARATPWDNKPKIMLHLRPVTSKNACNWGNLADCTTASVSGWTHTPYYCYLLGVRGNLTDIAGLQCGIEYTNGAVPADGLGIDIFSWTLCATLDFPTGGPAAWLLTGGGNLITWDYTERCQSGETAVAGYFYLTAYDPSLMSVRERPVDHAAKLADCSAVEHNIWYEDRGWITFSDPPYMDNWACNPCAGSCFFDPVQVITWGGIKTLLR